MSRVALLSLVLVALSSVGVAPAGAQVQPEASLLFDRPVPFDSIEELALFYDESGVLNIYPVALRVEADSLKLAYSGARKRDGFGILSFEMKPVLDQGREKDALEQFLRSTIPNVKLQYGRAKLSRLSVTILDRTTNVTPFSSVVQIGKVLRVVVAVESDALPFFLNEVTTGVPLGNISLLYTLSGKEATAVQAVEIVQRRYAVSGVILGSCGAYEDNYVSVDGKRPGCIEKRAIGRAERTELQRILAERGLYNGPLDGVVGPKTRTAIRGFQKSKGLRETGELNYPTVAALYRP